MKLQVANLELENALLYLKSFMKPLKGEISGQIDFELKQKSFIKEIKDKKNNKTYSITKKRKEYLTEFKTMSKFLDYFGLE